MAVKDVATLTDVLPKLAMPQMDRKAQPLWHNAWWLIAIVLLLAGEWAIRRSGGVI